MSTKKPTLRDCAGCRNDFYNRNRIGLNESDGPPRCWSFGSAEFVKAYDIPKNRPPPYKGMRLTKRPNCYHTQGYVRVKPEALNKAGYWRF